MRKRRSERRGERRRKGVARSEEEGRRERKRSEERGREGVVRREEEIGVKGHYRFRKQCKSRTGTGAVATSFNNSLALSTLPDTAASSRGVHIVRLTCMP